MSSRTTEEYWWRIQDEDLGPLELGQERTCRVDFMFVVPNWPANDVACFTAEKRELVVVLSVSCRVPALFTQTAHGVKRGIFSVQFSGGSRISQRLRQLQRRGRQPIILVICSQKLCKIGINWTARGHVSQSPLWNRQWFCAEFWWRWQFWFRLRLFLGVAAHSRPISLAYNTTYTINDNRSPYNTGS